MKTRIIRAALLFLGLTAFFIHGVVYQTAPRALQEVFPGNDDIKRSSLYLTGAKMKKARKIAGKQLDLGKGLVIYYQGIKNGQVMGTAFIDTHRVRTLNQTLLILVSNQGKVDQIKLLSFNEPADYMAPERWVKQFESKNLKYDLRVDADIAAITGATLTAHAYSKAVRRVLTFHKMIR